VRQMKESELNELVKRIKLSDQLAFKMLFDFFEGAIFKFLLFKTKDAAAAEDLLQEVFLKLWKVRATLDERRSIKNYLYTIADNISLNHIRHLKIVTAYQNQAPSKLFSAVENPHFILEEKEWKLRLMNAIEALPEKTRVIFLMSRLEDLTYNEIAERLSLSVKTVEGHMIKALKSLRESVSKKL
jgi:RNA polymerase sigma-70 factor (ECF subfamily)